MSFEFQKHLKNERLVDCIICSDDTKRLAFIRIKMMNILVAVIRLNLTLRSARDKLLTIPKEKYS